MSTLGPNGFDTLIDAIRLSTRRLWIAVPWWPNDPKPDGVALLDAVTSAVGRGMDVRVAVREDESNAITVEELQRAGADLAAWSQLHMKQVHVDDRVIVFSANFS